MSKIVIYNTNDPNKDLKVELNVKSDMSDIVYSNVVYSDVKYSIKLTLDTQFELSSIKNLKIYIGDNEFYPDGQNKHTYTFRIGDAFKYFIGYINIRVSYEYNYVENVMYSSFFGIAIPDNGEHDLKGISLLEKVLANRHEYVKDEYKTAKGVSEKINIAERIINIYRKIYILKNNIIKQKSESEHFIELKKVKSINGNVLNNIVKNVGRTGMVGVETGGIKYKNKNYLPTKVIKNNVSLDDSDTYENRVIYSFLNWFASELNQDSINIESYDYELSTEQDNLYNSVKNGYKITTVQIDENKKEVRKLIVDRYARISDEANRLLGAYNKILKCRYINKLNKIELTSGFKSGIYHEFFKLMSEWLNRYNSEESTLNDELNFRSYLNNEFNRDMTDIYEEYVFIEINNYVKNNYKGFRRYIGDMENTIDNDEIFHNYVRYERKDSKIEIYKEPIIDANGNTEVGLFRNNNYKNANMDSNSIKYVPDYVIKFSYAGMERYLICDAKFCNSHSEQYSELLYKIGFKYGVGIGCINKNSRVSAVYILRGIGDESNNNIMFGGNTAYGILPINENNNNNENIRTMFRYALSKKVC